MLADINGNLADLRSEAAMASQRFCLRWNNHQSNLLSVFDQLLHDESFVDVTLAVEGQLLRAHKMVLSACSPYFQALFVGHPDKHPIVILKDVPYVDMRSLLDFMYRGEVSVDQDRLTAFLRVAESLRIKGLTEVNEDKCDLPSITSSLLGNQSAVPPPPPNLHRINQLGQHHHMPQKRYHHMSSHPLLGSALTAPKRKRGRPRKLSGSSDTPLDTSLGQEQQCSGASDLVQGSPEMMEMKMGLDFQSEVAQNNSAGSNASAGSNGSSAGAATASARKDEPTENGTDQTDPIFVRIKGEPEPTPSTSAQAKDEAFTRPLSRQGSESFKQDLTSSSSSSSSSGSSVKSEPTDKSRGLCTPEKPSAPQQSGDSSLRVSTNAPSTPTTTSTTGNSGGSSSSNNNNNNNNNNNSNNNNSSSSSNNNANTTNSGTTTPTSTSAVSPRSSTSSTPRQASNALQQTTTTTTTTTTSSTTAAAAAAAASPSPNANQSAGQGAMSAPAARQVPKRRMRRRATSQSQDPAEQLTEMSVRGLNLFRYASISEGVYQCTECAKSDIQKTFKNKYSFQRHAFLYHEGHQRKVFPCPVCGKEFSRPDKMKNHMKTVHDCFMPKDCVMPFGFFLPP